MRNTIISVLIFLSLFGFVYYSNNTLTDLCDNVSTSSQEIDLLILGDNWEDAYFETVELINEIQKNHMLASVYVNHNDFDNMINEAVKLSLYVRSHNFSDSIVSTHLLRYSADNISNLHETCIENIF